MLIDQIVSLINSILPLLSEQGIPCDILAARCDDTTIYLLQDEVVDGYMFEQTMRVSHGLLLLEDLVGRLK